MATLTSPIEEQNIVDRFADYVVSTANAGITWGTNSVPFSEMSTSYFGGTTSGKTIEISGNNITGDPINASTIYNTLVAETNRYTKIRNLRAILFVDGGGGNIGNYATPGVNYDQTAVAYLNDSYLQNVGSPANGGVQAGSVASDDSLEALFTNLRSSYNTSRANTQTIQINVCHSNCHSDCHGSRSRR